MPDAFGLGVAIFIIYFVAFIPPALLGLAVPYSILRLRNEQPADPQVGMKAAVQYFYSVAILIAMTGLTIVAVDLIAGEAPSVERNPFEPFDADFGEPEEEEAWFNVVKRTGVALIISGTLIALLCFSFGRNLTTKDHWPRIRRMFAGCRFAVQGIVSMIVLTSLLVVMLQENSFQPEPLRIIKSFLAVLMVWMPAWGIHLYLLMQASEQPPVAPGGPAESVVTFIDGPIERKQPGL